MAFNAEQFRKDAADAGYSSKEIEEAIAKESGNEPSPTNMGPAANQGMMAEVMSRLPEGAQTFQADAKNVMGIGLAAAGLGGAYTLYKAYQAHQDRALDREMKQLQMLDLKQRLGLVAPPAAAPASVAPPAPGMTVSGGNATPAQLAAFDQQFRAGTGQAPAVPAPVDRNTLAQQRIEEGQARGLGVQPPAPAAPTPQASPAAETPEQFLQRMDEKYGSFPIQPAAGTPEAPKTAAAIATEQPGSAVADAVVRDELAIPAAAQPPAEAAAEPEKTVPGRTRRNKTQIEQDLANAFAQAPPGMRPAAPRKTNKLPGDVIGQGGWHFYAGQGGTPEDWLRLYGRNPQPYNRVVADIKGGLLPVPPAPVGALGGDVPRQAYVPEFIRGRASPGGLVGLSAIAAALGLAGSEQGKEAMGRAAAAIKDIGISPDIFQGKGDELGRLGRGYVAAGNPNYLRELNAQLQTEVDPQRRSILMEEIRKAGGQ
jgi:hypothetical protein